MGRVNKNNDSFDDLESELQAQQRIINRADKSMAITLNHMHHGDPNKGLKRAMVGSPVLNKLGKIPSLFDIVVKRDPYLPTERNVFFRRPRTKRKRIINKWKKRECNWRTEPLNLVMFVNPNAKTTWEARPLSVSTVLGYERPTAHNLELEFSREVSNTDECMIVCNALGFEALKNLPDRASTEI